MVDEFPVLGISFVKELFTAFTTAKSATIHKLMLKSDKLKKCSGTKLENFFPKIIVQMPALYLIPVRDQRISSLKANIKK